jgi:hypothetical protein
MIMNSSGLKNLTGSATQNRQRVDSPIREETMQNGTRGMSPNKQTHANEQTEEWYKPELGEIPYAPLTKANREKIEKRDAEIAEKEAELEEIRKNIEQRKQERAEKEATFKAQDLALKKKRKTAVKGKK